MRKIANAGWEAGHKGRCNLLDERHLQIPSLYFASIRSPELSIICQRAIFCMNLGRVGGYDTGEHQHALIGFRLGKKIGGLFDDVRVFAPGVIQSPMGRLWGNSQ